MFEHKTQAQLTCSDTNLARGTPYWQRHQQHLMPCIHTSDRRQTMTLWQFSVQLVHRHWQWSRTCQPCRTPRRRRWTSRSVVAGFHEPPRWRSLIDQRWLSGQWGLAWILAALRWRQLWLVKLLDPHWRHRCHCHWWRTGQCTASHHRLTCRVTIYTSITTSHHWLTCHVTIYTSITTSVTLMTDWSMYSLTSLVDLSWDNLHQHHNIRNNDQLMLHYTTVWVTMK